MSNRETRAGGELRALGGRRVAGVLLRYGDLARLPDGRSERFEAGALDPIPARLPVNVQHDPSLRVGTLALSGDAGGIRAEGEVAEGVHALIRRGALNGFSVEFRAIRERVESAPLHGRGVRVIERGALLGAGIVDRGAYPGSNVEARRGLSASLSATVRTGLNMPCQCGLDGAEEINLDSDAFGEILDAVKAGDHTVFATPRGMADAVASTADGSLKLAAARDGLGISLHPIAKLRAARELVERVRAGMPVHARPAIDTRRSVYEVREGVAHVSTAWFSVLLVRAAPASNTGDLDALQLAEGRERRGMTAKRRRLLGAA